MPDPQTKYTRLMALAEWLERDPSLREKGESLRADPLELAALARQLALRGTEPPRMLVYGNLPDPTVEPGQPSSSLGGPLKTAF